MEHVLEFPDAFFTTAFSRNERFSPVQAVSVLTEQIPKKAGSLESKIATCVLQNVRRITQSDNSTNSFVKVTEVETHTIEAS
jgi:hypothetical protein